MMQARVNLITADPDRMGETIGYIKPSVRAAVESMDGSLGLSLYANAEIGVAVLESFWESRKALIHSEQMAAPRRTDVVHRAGGGRGGIRTGGRVGASKKARAASPREAAAVAVETVRSTGALIRAVEEYDLVFS